MKKHIYGPVPSRRLGFSLGVDLVPYKTCPYDCIYCQLGRTTDKTVERKEYIRKDEILSQVEEAISTRKEIDYITISGSGEPTLNLAIGEIIREIKKMTKISIAVITNGSLLWDEEVRSDLLSADLLLPSLDAADPQTFEEVNCPHCSLDFHEIVKGLTDLRREFKGAIWLEVMLIKGINDSPGEIDLFGPSVSGAGFDRIQLNTVVRPPSQKSASPLSAVRLEEIRDVFGRNCEIIAEFKSVQKQNITSEDIEAQILEMIKRRPATLADISTSSGIHRNEVIKYLCVLEMKDKIKTYDHKDLRYYEHK